MPRGMCRERESVHRCCGSLVSYHLNKMPIALLQLLARADGADNTESTLRLVLLLTASIAGCAILCAIVMQFARRNSHRHGPILNALAIVWGLLAAGSTILAIVQQWAWEKQHMQDVMSGYGDVHEAAPAYPWAVWSALGAGYVVLVIWAAVRER